MSTSKCSSSVADNAAAIHPKSIGQESYGYPHGSDPMSNASGALNAHAGSQARLVDHHYGHSGGNPYVSGNEMPVPQFHEFNPASPNGGTSQSVVGNNVHVTGNRQSIYDNDAYCDTTAGGGRRSRHRRQSRRSRKNKYTKVKKVRKYKKTKRRKSKKSRKRRKSKKGHRRRRSTIKVIRNLKL